MKINQILPPENAPPDPLINALNVLIKAAAIGQKMVLIL